MYKWLKWMFGLSMLNSCDVEQASVKDLMANQPSNAEGLSDNSVDNYTDRTSAFPPTIWTSYSTSSERTTCRIWQKFHVSSSQHLHIR